MADDALSDEEIKRVHRLVQLSPDIERMVEADKKARWLWAGARSLAIWVTAVTVGIAAAKSFLVDFFSGKH